MAAIAELGLVAAGAASRTAALAMGIKGEKQLSNALDEQTHRLEGAAAITESVPQAPAIELPDTQSIVSDDKPPQQIDLIDEKDVHVAESKQSVQSPVLVPGFLQFMVLNFLIRPRMILQNTITETSVAGDLFNYESNNVSAYLHPLFQNILIQFRRFTLAVKFTITIYGSQYSHTLLKFQILDRVLRSTYSSFTDDANWYTNRYDKFTDVYLIPIDTTSKFSFVLRNDNYLPESLVYHTTYDQQHYPQPARYADANYPTVAKLSLVHGLIGTVPIRYSVWAEVIDFSLDEPYDFLVIPAVPTMLPDGMTIDELISFPSPMLSTHTITDNDIFGYTLASIPVDPTLYFDGTSWVNDSSLNFASVVKHYGSLYRGIMNYTFDFFLPKARTFIVKVTFNRFQNKTTAADEQGITVKYVNLSVQSSFSVHIAPTSDTMFWKIGQPMGYLTLQIESLSYPVTQLIASNYLTINQITKVEEFKVYGLTQTPIFAHGPVKITNAGPSSVHIPVQINYHTSSTLDDLKSYGFDYGSFSASVVDFTAITAKQTMYQPEDTLEPVLQREARGEPVKIDFFSSGTLPPPATVTERGPYDFAIREIAPMYLGDFELPLNENGMFEPNIALIVFPVCPMNFVYAPRTNVNGRIVYCATWVTETAPDALLNAGVSPFPIALRGLHYQYWRGDMELSVGVASHFAQAGTIMLSWVPNDVMTSLIDVTFGGTDKLAEHHNTILDVSQGRTAVLNSKFDSAYGFLENPPFLFNTYSYKQGTTHYWDVCPHLAYDNTAPTTCSGAFVISARSVILANKLASGAYQPIVLSLYAKPRFEFFGLRAPHALTLETDYFNVYSGAVTSKDVVNPIYKDEEKVDLL